MAGSTNADSRHRLSVDTPPPPIPKEMQGSDNSVPLSPQWLLPKLGDNKLGLAAREPNPQVGKHSDPAKALGNVEDHSVTEKRKDVYRPSFYDTEKGRHDRWGDEEREANSVNRRDLRREGEELGDSRKLERWTNTASRYSGEARRLPSERWTDSGSREGAYEPRRESKWNTRWGPDDKESENRREKWSGKDGESSNDKGTHHLTVHAKDINSQGKDADKEGEHYRLWRSSLAVNRGKGESSPYVPSTTNKPAPMFGYGRGKGDTGASAFSADRGRVGSSASNASGGPARHFPAGTTSDRSNGSHRDSHILRYSRMKLLDICRTTDLKGYRMSFEWLQEFPSLMLADPLMPLSLIAPTAEELFILEAIDKGDVLSSGVPLASKDGSSGKSSVDSGLLLSTKSGVVGEDVAPVVSDHRDEKTGHRNKEHACYVESPLYDKCSPGFDSKVPSGESLCQSQEILVAEASKFEVPENIIQCRSQSVGLGSLWPSNDLRALNEDRSGSPDMGWLKTRKDAVIELKNRPADSSFYLGGDPQLQATVNLQSDVRTEPWIRRQPSETIELEGEGFMHVHGQSDHFILRDKLTDRKPQQYPSPEHLSLFYKDPQGQIQGPFSGSNLIEWFDAGYFGVDLLVRLASAPADTPFSLLGDVLPQLRTRVRPPPGFGSARQNDIVEVSNRGKFGGSGGIHAGVSDLELMKNGQILGSELKVKAENQFLESLMSGRISSSVSDNYSLSEGVQGFNGPACGRPSLGIENTTDMKYLPQNMPLEQQSPLLSPYRRLVGESPVILSKPDTIGEFQIPPKIPPQIGEVPHHIPQSLQHMDLLSILQSAANRTPPTSINSALPLWPNFPEAQSLKSTHGSLDIMKDTFELHPNLQNSQTGFGILPKRLQSQFQPPLASQTPVGSISSGVIPPEKLISSEFNQDAQMLNLLRQQYMLTQQLHSQVPLPTHLNQMELLLLMQRQQQEQQQNQLLMQQQQQHFLSHSLPGFHSYKQNNEPSFSLLSGEVTDDNTLKSSINQMYDAMAQSNRQMHALDSNDSPAADLSNLNLHGGQEASITDSIEYSHLNLPNQFINLTPHSNAMDARPLLDVAPTQTSNIDQMASLPIILSAGAGYAKDAFVPPAKSSSVGTSEEPHELLQTNEVSTSASDAVNNDVLSDKGKGTQESKLSVSEMIDGVKNSHGTFSEQVRGEAPELIGVEDAVQSEVKKASEKKSRKHKNSHLRAAAESGKVSVKAPGQKSKTNAEIGAVEKGPIEPAEPHYRATVETGAEICAPFLMESLDFHGDVLDKKTIVEETKVKEGEIVQSMSHNQAWKPAPGQKKTRRLLEIQVEEQRRSQTQSLVANTIPEVIPTDVSAAPLTGNSINSDQTYAGDTVQFDGLAQSISENHQNPWNMRNISQLLPDVLDKEILPKVSDGKDKICSEEKGTPSHTLPQMGAEIEADVDNDDFVEPKDTRRSRKRAAKNKSLAEKASLPSNSAALSVSASAPEQTKATRQVQQDKDLLPTPPAAPSLGDFVFWKGDQASTVPSPAWSTDSVKIQKPAFLRDIFKEQDKKNTKSCQQQTPMPTPTKVQPSKGSGGNSSSVLVPGSSPSKNSVSINSKSAASTQTSSLSLGQHKTGMEDDFFWGGPLDQSKEGNRSDFPSLANPSSQKVKGTPGKGVHGEGSSKKSSSSKPVENSITSSPAISRSLSKGKKDKESKYSEAIDFRHWCEGEWSRLTGTNDTSFLEFCLKQPTTEAAVLLRENLASLDRDHDEFIDKFINYKEFLSSEIIEMAFQSRQSSKARDENQLQASHGSIIPRNLDGEADDGVEGSSKGKKKGKKGKKFSPALLGFNVVSNRIMMGEIQTIED